MNKVVLLIDDEQDIRNVVELNLNLIGLAAEHAENGEVGLAKAIANEYALVILDVVMPKLGGVEVCRRIREAKPDLPIIMLTEKKEEIDRVLGLELGADDYVTKPFSVPELMARVKNILKRLESVNRSSKEKSKDSYERIEILDMLIDCASREVSISGNNIELTATEFDLLVYLANEPGRTFTRSQILAAVWGINNPKYEVNVRTTINRLRKKIEPDLEKPIYILTARGVGYRFARNG